MSVFDIEEVKKGIAGIEAGAGDVEGKYIGKFQFGKPLVKALNKKYVKNPKTGQFYTGFTRELDARNPKDQEQLMDLAIADYSEVLKNKKVPITKTSLYLSHLQ